jgi:iduronate 2-sulfatase
VTLAQHFKNNGYHSQGLSKIYHGTLDDRPSWSVPHWRPGVPNYGPDGQKLLEARINERLEQGQTARWRKDRIKGPPWEAPDVPDNALPDGVTADKAIELLREHKGNPFFLAVGFFKPHLPFVAPKKYWDLYDEKKLRLASNPFAPKDCPPYALTEWGELRSYIGMPQTGPLSEAQARKMIHGYYASVSYIDAQIGRMLDELEKLGLSGRTVVILWGDHGWQLGEHGMWCKHTNFETSARAPLIISVPGQKNAGKKTDALVEFVDIYPSLADICGLPMPDGLEGTSFKPLLDDPKRAWKKAAFSQYPRAIPGQGRGRGYSIRTDRYRLTEWSVPEKDFREYELYDHKNDPDENVNLAANPKYARQVKELAAMLQQGWRAAVPPARSR